MTSALRDAASLVSASSVSETGWIGVVARSSFRVLLLALVVASAGGAGFWADQQ